MCSLPSLAELMLSRVPGFLADQLLTQLPQLKRLTLSDVGFLPGDTEDLLSSALDGGIELSEPVGVHLEISDFDHPATKNVNHFQMGLIALANPQSGVDIAAYEH